MTRQVQIPDGVEAAAREVADQLGARVEQVARLTDENNKLKKKEPSPLFHHPV